MSRFNYVKYDEDAAEVQAAFKKVFEHLEGAINEIPIETAGRAKALALTKLEECYMWVGKAIRDDQIDRNKQTELQEERNDS